MEKRQARQKPISHVIGPLADHVPQAPHPNLKIFSSRHVWKQRWYESVFNVHCLWCQQAHTWRYPQSRFRVRITWLDSARSNSKGRNAQQRQIIHGDSLAWQTQDRLQDRIIYEHFPISELHNGVPRILLRRQRMFLVVQTRQRKPRDHSSDWFWLYRLNHFKHEPRKWNLHLPPTHLLALN